MSLKIKYLQTNYKSASNIVLFSDETFNMESGNIEKGKVVVQVFEASTNYGIFLNGLDATNKGIDLNKKLKVGSMSEASINGNWGE